MPVDYHMNKRFKSGRFCPYFSHVLLPFLTLAGTINSQPDRWNRPSGDGTMESPYQISQIEHLSWVSTNVVLSAGIFYALMSDLDAEKTAQWNDDNTDQSVLEGFVPVGTKADPFKGFFDGRGHVIRNLTVNRRNQSNVGLFGFIDSVGKVANLRLEGCKVAGKINVGGLVGSNNRGSIINCMVTGTVEGDYKIGGMLGKSSGFITNSYSKANVFGNCHVGGLSGENCGGVLIGCFAAGGVIGEDCVGGLLGMNYGLVETSYAAGSVKGSWWCGGLIGQNFKGTVSQCHATGTVEGEWDTGGLVGENFNSTIVQCRANGSVNGNFQSGGLVGNNDSRGQITRSYASGSVSASGDYTGGLSGDNVEGGRIAQCYSTGPVAGGVWTGGLVGYNGRNYPANCTITQCYATGKVTSVGDPAGYNVGALVGKNYGSLRPGETRYDGTITMSYWNLQTSGWLESTNGFGKTTTELCLKATYAGWDFTNIWTINEGISYPCLRSTPELENQPLQPPFELFVMVAGAGSVKITPEKNSYDAGEKVTLTAIPITADFEFAGWLGLKATTSTGPTLDLTMTNHKFLVATFQIVRSISSMEELQKIGHDPAYPLDGRFRLAQDLDATGNTNFTPIGGNSGDPFTGKFDGCGHVIRNLTVSNAMNSFNIGLFGSVGPGGVLKNLGLEGGRIAGKGNVGGLAGGLNFGIITNCHTSGQIIGRENAGGLVGLSDHGDVFGCISRCDVSGDSEIGGLIGQNEQGTVLRCHAAGMITGTNYSQKIGGLIGWSINGVIMENTVGGQVSGHSYVGGLVGGNWTGPIIKCSATNQVTGFFMVGGLTGYNDEGIISACNISPTVAGDENVGGMVGASNGGELLENHIEGSIKGNYRVGGLVGGNWGGTLDNCRAIVSVIGKRYVGGLAGCNDQGYITSCMADGSVEGIFNNGGLLGSNTGSVTNSYSKCNVLGQNHTGGLAGENRGGLVVECYAAGAVFGKHCAGGLLGVNWGVVSRTHTTGPVQGDWWCGGLIGQNFKGTISQCYSVSPVVGHWDTGGLVGENFNSTIVQSRASGPVSGAFQSGGLVGNNDSRAQIIQSHAGGAVSASDEHAGGLAGDNLTGSCILYCYATGSVMGGVWTGGLVGFNGGYYTTNCTITQCYAIGKVVSIGDPANWKVGGLVGDNYETLQRGQIRYNGIISMSYWDTQTSGWWEQTNGIGKTTAELQKQATFAGWDFANVWRIEEGKSYPHLRSTPPLMAQVPQPPFVLSVMVQGDGFVAINPQKASYEAGERLTLSGIPSSGGIDFAGWSGIGVTNRTDANIEMVMDNHKFVVAIFQTSQPISSMDALQKIGRDPAYPLDGRFRLAQDIDATGYTNFMPIACYSRDPFTGTFDGRGHIIYTAHEN